MGRIKNVKYAIDNILNYFNEPLNLTKDTVPRLIISINKYLNGEINGKRHRSEIGEIFGNKNEPKIEDALANFLFFKSRMFVGDQVVNNVANMLAYSFNNNILINNKNNELNEEFVFENVLKIYKKLFYNMFLLVDGMLEEIEYFDFPNKKIEEDYKLVISIFIKALNKYDNVEEYKIEELKDSVISLF